MSDGSENHGVPTILGLATAWPEHVMTQEEAVVLAQTTSCRTDDQKRLVRGLYRKAGVQTRRFVVPYTLALEWFTESNGDLEARQLLEAAAAGATIEASISAVEQAPPSGPPTSRRMEYYYEHARPLALEASAKALAEGNTPPETITHIVTVSCTGFAAPGIDATLIETLGLPRTVGRIHVGFMGCHGAVNGLRAATALVRADPKARVLLCAVELCSLHYTFDADPGSIVGNAIFADGAAAMVLGSSEVADGSETRLQASAVGSCLLPDSADAMSWEVGDHGFVMSLSPRIPQLIRDNLRPWFDEWLAEQGLTIGEIGSWAVHPGGPRILTAVEESLGLDRSATTVSRAVLGEFGNMSSPTILFILDRLRRSGAPMPCVAMGFGPGLAAEVALFR